MRCMQISAAQYHKMAFNAGLFKLILQIKPYYAMLRKTEGEFTL